MRKYTFQIFKDVEDITREDIHDSIKPIKKVSNIHIQEIVLYGEQDEDEFENITFAKIIQTLIDNTKAFSVSTEETFIKKRKGDKSVKITLILL